MTKEKKLKIAAVGDVHYTKHCKGRLEPLFAEVSSTSDVLLLCGDLTDHGLAEEASILAEDLRSHLRVPALAVAGNHDFESGQITKLVSILDAAGIHMLDGETFEIGHVGFAGICGFGGGFGKSMLNAWGEPIIKSFVQEAVDQALKLEKALAQLHSQSKIAIMHYSPIRETVVGENEEIFPFLGSSRLEAPLNQFGVQAVFHGHAHNGHPEGRTTQDIPVYNVAMPLLKKDDSDGPHYKLVEL